MLYGAGLKMFWHPPLHCHLVILHELPLNIICLWSKPSWHGCYSLSYFSDSSEKPIVYASCKLTKAERNYSQIQTKSVRHQLRWTEISQYWFGRPFNLITDHKPWTVSFSSGHWQNQFWENWWFGDCVCCGASALQLDCLPIQATNIQKLPCKIQY